MPDWLIYAIVQKTRKHNRVVGVRTRLVFGTVRSRAALLWAVLGCVTTVCIERSHGTDRHRNSRKVRETYRFSKDWGVPQGERAEFIRLQCRLARDEALTPAEDDRFMISPNAIAPPGPATFRTTRARRGSFGAASRKN